MRWTSMPELTFNNDELKKLKNYKSDLDWFQSIYPELKEKFKGQYVAIKDKKIIAHDADLLRLLNTINDDTNSMVIEYINEEKSLYIL
jgi:hypothetical protein